MRGRGGDPMGPRFGHDALGGVDRANGLAVDDCLRQREIVRDQTDFSNPRVVRDSIGIDQTAPGAPDLRTEVPADGRILIAHVIALDEVLVALGIEAVEETDRASRPLLVIEILAEAPRRLSVGEALVRTGGDDLLGPFRYRQVNVDRRKIIGDRLFGPDDGKIELSQERMADLVRDDMDESVHCRL